MPSAAEVFRRCGQPELLPEAFVRNYHAGLVRLQRQLPHGARVLQVGSMDGLRLVRLSRQRPDLRLTGLDSDAGLVRTARENAAAAEADV